MAVSARATACSGRRARLASQSHDQVAQARVAMAHPASLRGHLRPAGRREREHRAGARRGGRAKRLELAACVFERVQLIEEESLLDHEARA